MNYNRAAMKEEVKQAMRQVRPHPMLVTLLFLVVVGAGTSTISWVTNTLFSGGASMNSLLIAIMDYGPDYFEDMLNYAPQLFIQLMLQSMVVSFIASVLSTAWNGLMDVGYAGYCLDMVRGMNPALERIFGGFSRAGSVILAYILVAVFTSLWGLLFGLGMVVLFFIAGILMAIGGALAGLGVLLMAAAYVGFFIALFWAVLRYAMVPYAITDSQNPMSAMDAIRASKTIMKGRTGSLFVLHFSFIGWYLLEYLVVVVAVGVVIAIFAAASSIGSLDYILYYNDPDNLVPLLTQLVGPVLLVVLLCGAAIFAINLWLTPYRTGCIARFYLYATGDNQPIRPGPYGGYPGPYGSQPGPYGGQSGYYGGQSGSYGGQSGPYGGQSGSYGGQSGSYGGQSGSYGGQSGSYGGPSGSYGGQSGSYGGQSGSYGGQSGSYGGQSGSYGSQSSSYGSQSGPYSSGPYGYTPPSQSSFSGYTPAEQPPQRGTGTYPQWGVPQAPQAPAAPAAPETPAVPDPFVPAKPAEPVDDAPYEEPYAEPEAPNDDTPPRPNGPIYPQY